MNTTKRASAALLALSLSTAAHAVHLDPGGRGQVLIFPYYTVNKQQQTLVSVTNTSSVAQALKVRFKEGYNGRGVLDFNLFLSPFDSWTATVFALEAVGEDSEGAAVLNADTSCTAPPFSEGDGTINGNPFVSLRNYAAPDDGGPYGLGRTREGYVEIYAMADVAAPLSAAIAHGSSGSAPTGCAQVRNLLADNAALSKPTGGLMGSVSVIDVARGTYLSVRAEALGGFTGSSLFTGIGNPLPNLDSVNDGTGALATRATAQVFASVTQWRPFPLLSTSPADLAGKWQSLTFPGPDPKSRKVDAVSAVFMADRVYNGYQISPDLGASSDWLVTMPTRSFYADPLYVAPLDPAHSGYVRPFDDVIYRRFFYDENGGQSGGGYCIPSGCNASTASATRSVNVLPVSRLAIAESAVLGSQLISQINTGTSGQDFRPPAADAGWMHVGFSTYYGVGQPGVGSNGAALLPSAEGKILLGWPVIGFWASNIVNNNVSNGVLANYAAAVRHATSVTCVKASDGRPCD